jgi:hypothetical protein
VVDLGQLLDRNAQAAAACNSIDTELRDLPPELDLARQEGDHGAKAICQPSGTHMVRTDGTKVERRLFGSSIHVSSHQHASIFIQAQVLGVTSPMKKYAHPVALLFILAIIALLNGPLGRRIALDPSSSCAFKSAHSADDHSVERCQDLSRDTGFCTLARIAFCACTGLITHNQSNND